MAQLQTLECLGVGADNAHAGDLRVRRLRFMELEIGSSASCNEGIRLQADLIRDWVEQHFLPDFAWAHSADSDRYRANLCAALHVPDSPP